MSTIYLLNNEKYENIVNLPLFDINFIKSDIDLSTYDALIFTSKNAIYSLNSFNKQWLNIPSYAIASKTAQIIKQQGGIVEFTGISSHGDDFANELIPLLKNKKVLFISAKKNVSNILEILKKAEINIQKLITYETKISNQKNLILDKHSIIIFSSPSSVDGFFKYYKWNKAYQAIVIGKTTAKYLPKDVKYTLSPKTSLQTCIDIANELKK